jgi:hypothetical protein
MNLPIFMQPGDTKLSERFRSRPMTAQATNYDKLLVNGFRLGFGKELLKLWVVPNWIPDGVDLQTRNRNVLSGRDCEQLSKYSDRLFGRNTGNSRTAAIACCSRPVRFLSFEFACSIQLR